MHSTTPLLPLACVLVFTTFAEAPAEAADVSLNAGLLEVAGMPKMGHLGLYPYVAGALIFAGERVTIIPSLGIEWSPELERWGGLASVVLDFPVVDHLGFDLNLTLIHDQSAAEFAQADYFFGGGAGVSIFMGAWTISPSVSVFHGLTLPGWTISPGINLGFTL